MREREREGGVCAIILVEYGIWVYDMYIYTHTHTLTHSLTLPQTVRHTHTLSYTLRVSLSLSLSLSDIHSLLSLCSFNGKVATSPTV